MWKCKILTDKNQNNLWRHASRFKWQTLFLMVRQTSGRREHTRVVLSTHISVQGHCQGDHSRGRALVTALHLTGSSLGLGHLPTEEGHTHLLEPAGTVEAELGPRGAANCTRLLSIAFWAFLPYSRSFTVYSKKGQSLKFSVWTKVKGLVLV